MCAEPSLLSVSASRVLQQTELLLHQRPEFLVSMKTHFGLDRVTFLKILCALFVRSSLSSAAGSCGSFYSASIVLSCLGVSCESPLPHRFPSLDNPH